MSKTYTKILKLSLFCIQLLNLILKVNSKNVIILLPGSQNAQLINVNTSSPKIYKINGTNSIGHVIRSEGNINCNANWYIGAGHIPSKNDKYYSGGLSNAGVTYVSYKPIKCDWFFKIEISNEPVSGVGCNYRISAAEYEGLLPCCQTQCHTITPTTTPPNATIIPIQNSTNRNPLISKGHWSAFVNKALFLIWIINIVLIF